MIEVMVTEIGRSNHWLTYSVTMLFKCSYIRVFPKSATVRCQEILKGHSDHIKIIYFWDEDVVSLFYLA